MIYCTCSRPVMARRAPSAVASGHWGAPVRRGDGADRRGPRHALPASAIEASSAAAATKLGG